MSLEKKSWDNSKNSVTHPCPSLCHHSVHLPLSDWYPFSLSVGHPPPSHPHPVLQSPRGPVSSSG